MTRGPTIHRLKVTLRQVKPPVWRRIEVPSNTKLSELAVILEAAIGWYGDHLHAFEAGGVSYQPRREIDEFDRQFSRIKQVDESKARVGTVLPAVKAKMRWDYDFGDGWEHDVVVEAIELRHSGVVYPRCIDGNRSGPPEDCGGPWGYGDLLEAIADPTNPEHQDRIEWLGGEFDPEHFDVDETTEAMRSPRPTDDW
jgi:pRiA4b ORF-3-like protein